MGVTTAVETRGAKQSSLPDSSDNGSRVVNRDTPHSRHDFIISGQKSELFLKPLPWLFMRPPLNREDYATEQKRNSCGTGTPIGGRKLLQSAVVSCGQNATEVINNIERKRRVCSHADLNIGCRIRYSACGRECDLF